MTSPVLPADFTAATAPTAIESLAARIALISGCSLSIDAAIVFALLVSHSADWLATISSPASFIASSKPRRRWTPLKAVVFPSNTATLSPLAILLGQEIADLFRSGLVVGSDERNGDVFRL